MTKGIKSFCKEHDACSEGVEWALENCADMADVWDKAKPEWLIWVATRPGVLDDRTLRLFAVACCRSIQRLMRDKRSIHAVDVAERYAHGNATEKELANAARAARNAARNAAAAWYAAWAAAWAADAAGASWDAANAAWEAAGASWDAARAEYEGEREKQASWLRENVKNPWLDK